MLDILKDIWNSYMNDTEFFIYMGVLVILLVISLIIFLIYNGFFSSIISQPNYYKYYDLSDVPTHQLYEAFEYGNNNIERDGILVPRSAIKAELKRRKKIGR